MAKKLPFAELLAERLHPDFGYNSITEYETLLELCVEGLIPDVMKYKIAESLQTAWQDMFFAESVGLKDDPDYDAVPEMQILMAKALLRCDAMLPPELETLTAKWRRSLIFQPPGVAELLMRKLRETESTVSDSRRLVLLIEFSSKVQINNRFRRSLAKARIDAKKRVHEPQM